MVAISSGFLALAISLIFWPIARLAVTVAHEGGHAMTASMMGGSVTAISVSRKTGGLTETRGVGPVGSFFTAIAGYIGPSVFGLFGAALLVEGQVRAVLWISAVFLAMALLQSKNFGTAFVVICVGALLYWAIRYATEPQQTFFAYTWIWFLLIGGFGGVIALQGIRAGGADTSSDAYLLRRMTYLPSSLWSGFFWLATLAALVYGAGLLLGVVTLEVGTVTIGQ
jgi:hypothetical protein